MRASAFWAAIDLFSALFTLDVRDIEKGIALSRTTVLANRLKAAFVLIPNSLQRESNCSLISESRRIEIAVVDIMYSIFILQRYHININFEIYYLLNIRAPLQIQEKPLPLHRRVIRFKDRVIRVVQKSPSAKAHRKKGKHLLRVSGAELKHPSGMLFSFPFYWP